MLNWIRFILLTLFAVSNVLAFTNFHYSKIRHNPILLLKRDLSMNDSTKLNKKILSTLIVGAQIFLNPGFVLAKEETPSLEKCFNAVRRELSPNGESLVRLKNDIINQNWDDIKVFTREYDAGFRGYVMKNVWKQLEDPEKKKKGIEVSNSFTFDLIALNKAARIKDSEEAIKRLDQVTQDLKDFLLLDLSTTTSQTLK
jgi:hypothetical protein